ncbi:RNA-binding protein [Photobacterium sp. GJ3]|uniref:RNA recognition motif domain-containing protein n=1 Tax=Photobacterium sp. GJ3 TaxID=2829502 RepID=UPI001B8AC014|nr:RNA-binding protein [Photobacterium sp. GJ3]QUJ67619.1 RNA-binding protein [Photobacterium sp. GJ3]
MKLSNSHTITIALITLIGAVIFSFISSTAAIAFLLGSILSGFASRFIGNAPSDVPFNEDNQSSKTLYVGNLPYRANEGEVKDLFAEYGEVFAVRLMKDKRTGKRRGFGFVVMSSKDAAYAISQLNEKEFGQRTLKVREANEPKNGDSEDNSRY